MKLTDIQTKKILDSRGSSTIQVMLTTEDGLYEASVPAGKSTGTHEAAVIDPEMAEDTLSVIRERLLSQKCEDIGDFDALIKDLDGTENKSRLGANLMLALSIAWTRAQAASEKKELHRFLGEWFSKKKIQVSGQIPYPIFNVINGGVHANIPAEWRGKGIHALDFQEFQVIPTTRDFPLAFSVGCEYYRKLRAALEKKFGKDRVLLGDEAGFMCPFRNNEEALEIMAELIFSQKYPLRIGIDAAATQFFSDGAYMVEGDPLTAENLMKKYESITYAYSILSIEDPFQEEDFENFSLLTSNLHAQTGPSPENLVITDDLTTTNPDRLKTAIERKSGNAILVKPNQIGTVSETLDVLAEAYKNGWQTVVSHRSGETMDDFIADLAVAAGAWGLKAGAPGKPERVAKYQRVLEIVQP